MAQNQVSDPTADYWSPAASTQTNSAAPAPAPPWFQGTMPPFAQGQNWSTVGPQTDPQGNQWTFDPGSNSWSQDRTPNLGGHSPSLPPSTGGDTSGGGGGGGSATGGAPGGGLFDPSLYAPFTGTPPSFITPTLPTAPQWQTPPAFSYQDFQAPTLDQAAQQPGYQFGLQQGEQALQQSRAAQGLLRTGGTLKDILSYGQNAANQNYSNVLNQDQGIYNINRAGAVQAYNTNYQTQYVDPYQAQVLPYQTQSANAQHQADAQNAFNWNNYTNSEDLFFNQQNAPFQKYLSLAQLGAANA